jgi:3-oxoacyl-[acyl-carrier protein] reductase
MRICAALFSAEFLKVGRHAYWRPSPIMKAQNAGKIVTVASIAALGPSVDGGYAHYGAAKAAILHYTRYLAQDLGPYGITVNCIAPGTITTGRIVASVMPNQANATRDRTEQVALRRLGTVEDCAKVVEFLVTDLSDNVSGQCIAIDGGMVRSAYSAQQRDCR